MAWTITTGSGNVAGCWRNPEGKVRSKTFKVATEADREAAEKRALKYAARKEIEVEREEYVDRASGRLTLEALYEQVHEARPYAPATVRLHEELWAQPVLHSLKVKQLRSIGEADVDAILQKIAAPAMRQKTRLLISTLYNYAIETRLWTSNPARLRAKATTRAERMERSTDRRAERRYLTTEELNRLLAEIGPHHRAAVLLWVAVRCARVRSSPCAWASSTHSSVASGSTARPQGRRRRRAWPVPCGSLRPSVRSWSSISSGTPTRATLML